MDKRGEQTPAGGIDLGGRPTVSEGEIAFCSDRTKSGAEGAIQARPAFPMQN